jgi:general secretion pathway protein G
MGYRRAKPGAFETFSNQSRLRAYIHDEAFLDIRSAPFLVRFAMTSFSSISTARTFPNRQRGFTLLEIMVVLAILGLLVAVLVKNVGGDLDRGQRQGASLFVKSTLSLPLTTFRIDIGSYPTTAQGLQALITAPQSGTQRWTGPYLDVPSGKVPLDPWQQPYEYRFPGVHNKSSYDLFSKGPDQSAGTEDDIGNW